MCGWFCTGGVVVVPEVAVVGIVAVIDHDERAPGLDQPPRQQAAPADLGAAVALADAVGSRPRSNARADGRRQQHVEGAADSASATRRRPAFGVAQAAVELLAQRPAVREPRRRPGLAGRFSALLVELLLRRPPSRSAVKSSFFGWPPVPNGAYWRPSQPPTNRFFGGGPGRVVPGTAT